jgi:hypothetical protein
MCITHPWLLLDVNYKGICTYPKFQTEKVVGEVVSRRHGTGRQPRKGVSWTSGPISNSAE